MTATVRARPRVEKISWSLYWKEPLYIKTKCLPDVEVALPADATGADLLKAVAQHMGWRAVDTLQRIPGFTQPWERLILRGRELDIGSCLPADCTEPLVIVRRDLRADGWRITQDDDFLSSDDDDEDAADGSENEADDFTTTKTLQ